MFGYRNSCFDDRGLFPSELLFSFKPKTLLDLVNPKNSLKNPLTKPKVVDGSRYVSPSTVYKKPDWINKLRAGDPVYYKNFRPTDIRRWLEAIFLRRVSLNTFQVSVGGREYSAHRNQLKVFGNPVRRRGVVYAGGTVNAKRKREDDVDDEDGDDDEAEFYG